MTPIFINIYIRYFSQKLSRTSHASKVRHFSEYCPGRPTPPRCDASENGPGRPTLPRCDTFQKSVPDVPRLQGSTLFRKLSRTSHASKVRRFSGKFPRTSHASKVRRFSGNCPGRPTLPRCDTFQNTVPDVPRFHGATLFRKLSRTSHASKVRRFSENCPGCPTLPRCDSTITVTICSGTSRCDAFQKSVPDVPRFQGATLFRILSRTSHTSKVRRF